MPEALQTAAIIAFGAVCYIGVCEYLFRRDERMLRAMRNDEPNAPDSHTTVDGRLVVNLHALLRLPKISRGTKIYSGLDDD